MAFYHKALEEVQSTRILQLAPAKSKQAPLECRLIEISLEKPPQYEAISYVWGSQVRTSHILCNGRRLPITANCDAALRRFRLQKHSRDLWVDSVCIDQATVHERNHQARIMDEVYEKAVNVLIWLGEGNKATDDVFDLFRGRSYAHFKQGVRLWLDNYQTNGSPSYIYYEPIPNVKLLKIPGMSDIMRPVLVPSLLSTIGPSLNRLALEDRGPGEISIRWKTVPVVKPREVAQLPEPSNFSRLHPDYAALGRDKNNYRYRTKWHINALKVRRKRIVPANVDLVSTAGAAIFHEEIMSLPWFHRMWTIQEAVLASRSHFYCGRESVAAERMFKALDGAAQLFEEEYASEFVDEAANDLPEAKHLRAISECLKLERALIFHLLWRRRASKCAAGCSNPPSEYESQKLHLIDIMVKHTRVPVSDILAYASRRGSSDPHDKFFALYGVLKRMDVDVPEPDYAKTVDEVYTEATNVAIRDEGKLTVLLQVTGLPSEHDLPSWVPDWDDRSRPEIIGEDIAKAFYAAKDSRIDLTKTSLDSKELGVSGRPVNRIKILSTAPFSRSDMKSTLLRLDETIRDWIRIFQAHTKKAKDTSFYWTGSVYWTSFYSALNYDSPLTSDKIQNATADYIAILMHVEKKRTTMDEYLRGVWHPVLKISGMLLPIAGVQASSEFAPDVERASVFDRARVKSAFEHREHLSRSLADKTFFWGFDDFCGTASTAIKRGDDIVLLTGLEMPAVVRHHCAKQSRFICPAYVDGYMHGEFWDRYRPRKHERMYTFV